MPTTRYESAAEVDDPGALHARRSMEFPIVFRTTSCASLRSTNRALSVPAMVPSALSEPVESTCTVQFSPRQSPDYVTCCCPYSACKLEGIAVWPAEPAGERVLVLRQLEPEPKRGSMVIVQMPVSDLPFAETAPHFPGDVAGWNGTPSARRLGWVLPPAR